MRFLRSLPSGALARHVRFAFFTLVALVGAAALTHSQTEPRPGGLAVVLELDGAVSPASADYIVRGMAAAANDGAALVIIRMDTPGGLDSSMRAINRAILASPVPVATYVAPSGARAASAGTYILYASHIAAMAPGTTLGAATPVQIGGGGLPFFDGEEDEEATEPAEDENATNGAEETAERAEDEAEPNDRFVPRTAAERKVLNDAIAYIRGLAELRGRNAEWAERAVREAVSLSASEAAEQNVIDFTATSITDLLERADGMVVTVGQAEVTLATEGLTVEERAPGLRNQILSIITDPNVAILLMVFGFYGIVFELINPGALVPGTIGAICLITGFYALAVLPVNIAGAALMLLGLALIVAEAFAPSFGILGIGGAVALALGATLLFDAEVPGMELSWPVIAAIGVSGAAFALLIARLAYSSHRGRVTTGREEMLGAIGRVVEWHGTSGTVFVHSERWRARSQVPLSPGTEVRVTGLDGLVLEVVPTAAPPEAPA